MSFVMGGAIGVGALAFVVARRRTTGLLGCLIQWPSAKSIEYRLLLGSAMFGIGWGLAGICPGPALVLLGAGSASGAVFVLAMLGGMALFELMERKRRVFGLVTGHGKPCWMRWGGCFRALEFGILPNRSCALILGTIDGCRLPVGV